MKKIGTREEVWEGKAEKTRGGLTKADLKPNARGDLVSIKRSNMAKELHPLGPSPETMFQHIAGGSAEDAALSLGGSYSRASVGGAFVSGVPSPCAADGGFLVSGAGSRAAEGGFLVSGAGSRAAEGGFLVSGAGDAGGFLVSGAGAPKKRGRPRKGGAVIKQEDLYDPSEYTTESGVHVNYYKVPKSAKFGTAKGNYYFILPSDMGGKYRFVRLFEQDGKMAAVVGANDKWEVLTVVNDKKNVGGSIIDDIIGLL
jgi:hypothetical protein